MNIGISLSGISYSNIGKKRDFRQTYQNFYDTLYIPLSENNSVSTYTTTYYHELTQSFLNYYKPTRHQFLSFEGSHPRLTFAHSLSMIEEEKLDIILCTRFDIFFNKKITEFDIKYDKFNFLFKEKNMWKSNKFVTDNLFIFPKKWFYSFYSSINSLCSSGLYGPHTFMHHIYQFVEDSIGKKNINFICGDEESFSHDNKYYSLVRTEI